MILQNKYGVSITTIQILSYGLTFIFVKDKELALGVVTMNLPRMAMQSKSKEEFFDNVSKMFDVCARINNAKRALIKKRIALNASPLYTLGFMDINRQYSTCGM